MRSSGDILLLSCYELGHQPFHLASLLAFLQQADYAPLAVDTAVEELSDEVIRRAQFVAISVPMHTALRLGEQLAQRVRRMNPAAYICLYGLYALLNADHLLQGTIDAAIGGEYEQPLLSLIEALEAHTSNAIAIVGVHTTNHKSGASLARTPFVVPVRESLPSLQSYAALQWQDEVCMAGYTETTRGCKHTCTHCPLTPVYAGRFFALPQQIVLADIRAQIMQGARHITFGDPDFWNGPTHALRITRALHEEFPDVTFDATIKIEHLLQHQHLLPAMKEYGCLFIVSAVESLNERVLLHLRKGHSRTDVSKAFDLLDAAGIVLRPSLLPFSPWETLESYLALLDFFEERHVIEHLDPVHLSIRLLLPPSSTLLDDEELTPWLDGLDAANYSYRWHHPDSRMDVLQQRIATLVEQAESNQSDSIETFFQVKAMAQALMGQDFSVTKAVQHYGPRRELPHLTESWFC